MSTTKEPLYKKVQDLFIICPVCKGWGELSKPPYDDSAICPECNKQIELGVGDVVECTQTHHKGNEYTIIDKDGNYFQTRDKYGRVLIPIKLCNLKIKLITLPMVLDKLKELWDKEDESRRNFVDYSYSPDVDSWEKAYIDLFRLWQLRKDNKDLSLYDQSIELLKLVYEVLK